MNILTKSELVRIIKDFNLYEDIVNQLFLDDYYDLDLKDFVFAVDAEESAKIRQAIDEHENLDKVEVGISALSNAYLYEYKEQHTKRVMGAMIELRQLLCESLENLIEIDIDKLNEAMNPDLYKERPIDEDLEFAIRIKKREE